MSIKDILAKIVKPKNVSQKNNSGNGQPSPPIASVVCLSAVEGEKEEVDLLVQSVSQNGGMTRTVFEKMWQCLSSAGINSVLNNISTVERQKYREILKNVCQ